LQSIEAPALLRDALTPVKFNVDHREDRKAEGAERGERQQLAERSESVLSLLAPCIHLILLEAPQFGLLPN
jgi:hypothetical protein